MTRVVAAAPQWRIDDNRAVAAAVAMRHGADELQLDFGGGHRGPRLDEPAELASAARIAAAIRVSTVAVNHANDIGLIDDHGCPRAAAASLLGAAMNCAAELGISVLHVPGFRRSAPDTPERMAGTATVLRSLCDQAESLQLTVAYESALDGPASAALARAVDHPGLRIVLDVGNLLDAGHSPAAFVPVVGALLHPDVHVKDPVTRAADGFEELCAALSRSAPIRCVLVENDYRAAPGRLAADLGICRGLPLPTSRAAAWS